MRTSPVPPPFSDVEELAKEIASRTNAKIRERGDERIIEPCPVAGCKGDRFAINTATGAWNCPKCGNRGNAWTLASMLGLAPVTGANRTGPKSARIDQSEIDRRHAEGVKFLQGCDAATAYLAHRGFTPETWTRSLLCAERSKSGQIAIGFPYFRQNGRIARIKFRSITDKSAMFWWPSKSAMPLPECSPLFLGNKLDPAQPVILTEGEYDALALDQIGLVNAASIANGAKNWDPEWSQQLATTNLVYCCFDNDPDGNAAYGELRHKLGPERVWRVTFGEHKDANDALKAGWDADRFMAAFTQAESEAPKILVHAREHAKRRIEEITNGTVPKPIDTGFPEFDRLEHGLRVGELTVLTGHSGFGKTTFALSLALRLAERGESVGVYSFEQGLDATQDQILSMLLNFSVHDCPHDRLRASLERYPENFWLGTEPENRRAKTVTDAMRYGRVVYGTKIVVVDHLDFLVDSSPDVSRYESATNAVKALHNAAIENGIHVILICQPTTDSGRAKGPAARPLKLADIAETRAARQLANNGWIFDADKESRTGHLYVEKARYGPARDHITIHFRFDNFRYHETGHSEGRQDRPRSTSDFA